MHCVEQMTQVAAFQQDQIHSLQQGFWIATFLDYSRVKCGPELMQKLITTKQCRKNRQGSGAWQGRYLAVCWLNVAPIAGPVLATGRVAVCLLQVLPWCCCLPPHHPCHDWIVEVTACGTSGTTAWPAHMLTAPAYCQMHADQLSGTFWMVTYSRSN